MAIQWTPFRSEKRFQDLLCVLHATVRYSIYIPNEAVQRYFKIIQDLQCACLRFGKLLSQSVSSHKAFYAISSKIPTWILTPGWIGEQKYQQIYIFFIITLGQTFETNIHWLPVYWQRFLWQFINNSRLFFSLKKVFRFLQFDSSSGHLGWIHRWNSGTQYTRYTIPCTRYTMYLKL